MQVDTPYFRQVITRMLFRENSPVRLIYGARVPVTRVSWLWHAVTAVVCAFALVVQVGLTVSGANVLVAEEQPPLGVRLWQFVSYFTIQANVLVLISAITLVRDPAADGPGWRVLRTCVLTGITVTGLVHWFLLRPLLDLQGWSWTADKLVHVVVPILTVLGWFLFGPRPRIDLRAVGWSLLWPAGWLVYTLAIGALRGWYPYPFLNPGRQGAGAVVVASLSITVLFVGLAAVFAWLDRALPPRPGAA